MKKFLSFFILPFFSKSIAYSQIIFVPTGMAGASIMPETGFLPGKKFPIYKTIQKFDFNGLTSRIEIIDQRSLLNLEKIECSSIPLNNITELNDQNFILKFGEYVDSIFAQANIKIDSSSLNKMEITLEAIDSRLIGFGKIVAHGLCQIKVNYNNRLKIYCVDLTDSDKNAPISSNSFVTRKTAIRVMGSAAIREVLEQVLIDLNNQ